MRIRIAKKVDLFAPRTLGALSLGLFLCFWVFPALVYQRFIEEKNLVNLSASALLFFLGGAVAFLAGAKLRIFKRRDKPPVILKPIWIAVPLGVAGALNAVSVLILLRTNPWMLTGWINDAAAVKADFDATGGLSEALPLLFACCWWAYARTIALEQLTAKKRKLLRLFIWTLFSFAVFTSLMKVARYDLMPGLFGMVIISRVLHRKSVGGMAVFRTMLLMGILFIGVFAAISVLRGADSADHLWSVLLGYSGASYNRMAYLVQDQINLPYGGTGTYAFRFLSHVPLFQSMFDIAGFFGLPDPADVLASEFGAVSAAGLDPAYIWVTAFGYVYADIGLLYLFYFFVVGLISAAAWRSLKAGRTVGAVMYPWIAFCILFWIGSNFFPYPRLITFIVAAGMLSMYEKIFGRRLI